jgi:hypothetical protein
MAPCVHAAWVRGVTHGGRGRSQRAVRGSSMAAVCVEGIWAVLVVARAVSEPYAWPQRAVRFTRMVGGGGIDVVHERGSESIGIFVVLRRHTRSPWHTCTCTCTCTCCCACGHRAVHAVHGERTGAIHVAAHAWGGMHETRERSQRAESDQCVEKYTLRWILRIIPDICASLRAISGLYTRSGGGTRGGGVRSAL